MFAKHVSKTKAIQMNINGELKNSLVISIVSPNEQNPQFDCIACLSLKFHDVLERQKGKVAFDSSHANAIINFIKKNNSHDIIIHCEAGLSRSAAVVRFLVEHFGYVGVFANTNNLMVYQNLCKAIGEVKTNSFYENLFNQKQLFLDMDGVFADLIGECQRRGINVNNPHTLWKGINSIEESMFGLLPKLSWADDLWNMTKHYNPTFLTGDPKMEIHRKAKVEWLKRHFDYDDIIIHPSKLKQEYAGNGNVLIDDSDRNINNWKNAGGVGVLFVDFDTSYNDICQALVTL